MIERLSQAASEHGLGIVLSVFIAVAFLYVLKKIIENHQEDRKTYVDIISKQNGEIVNNLRQVNKSLIENDKAIQMHSEHIKSGVDKICTSIETQTKLLKSSIYRGEDK